MEKRTGAHSKSIKKTAILYFRKSTDETGTQENSLEVQSDACNRFCQEHGIQVVGSFSDKVSGTTPFGDRTPGLMQVVETARVERASYVVCHRSDRLSRSIAKLYEVKSILAKMGCQVVFADDGSLPNDQDEFATMREVLVGLQSQMTVMLLRKRTKEALQNKKMKGDRWCKNAPYGMKWQDGKMIPNQEEAFVVERMHALSESGSSVLGIAKVLTQEGYRSRTGKNFSHMTVRRILAKVA